MVEASTKPSLLINTVNPGFCLTELYRDVPFPIGMIMRCLLYLFGRTPEMGSRNLVAAAVAGEETHGKYIADCVITNPSRFVQSEEGHETGKRAYDELLDILESVSPGISETI